MKITSLFILCLLFVYSSSQGYENHCNYIDFFCPPPPSCDSNCGLTFNFDTCCQECCDESCSICEQDPCRNWFCVDNEDWTCVPNTCGGCNRVWYDDFGVGQICTNEIIADDPAPQEWDVSCNVNSDCSLHNEELDFACCYTGFCDVVDYEMEKYQPVNEEWWFQNHQECSFYCGPAPECPNFEPLNTNYQAHCIANQCTKVNTQSTFETNSFTTIETNSFTTIETNSFTTVLFSTLFSTIDTFSSFTYSHTFSLTNIFSNTFSFTSGTLPSFNSVSSSTNGSGIIAVGILSFTFLFII